MKGAWRAERLRTLMQLKFNKFMAHKTKIKKKARVKKPVSPINESAVYDTAAEPWEHSRTKQEAYARGRNNGYVQGHREATERAAESVKQAERKKAEVEIRALELICNAGSLVIEGMSKSYLAFKGQL